MSNGFGAAQAEQIRFWNELCPALSVEGTRTPPTFDVPNPDQLLATLRHEGYINVPGILPEGSFAPLRDCVVTLHEQRIPLAFAFVYAEFWHAFQGLRRLLEIVLGQGYRALPDFWVWHVLPVDSEFGWGPHRDRVQPTLDADNSPHSFTVWLPLSDATPLNGCIYVLPAHLDERFKRRRWDGPDNNVVKEPQSIRALPASAGSVLGWNQAILHWGSRASRLGAAPRTSMAFEFQRGDKPPFNRPLLDPTVTPPFERRLGLIGKQVLQYEHMYPLKPDVADIAKALRNRFMPELAPPPVNDDIEWESGGGGGGGGG